MDKTELVSKIIELEQQANKVFGHYAFKNWIEMELTIAQLKSLLFIVSTEKCNFKKLADVLGVTPANITGIIDRLVEQGMVARVENPEDRRVMLLQATEKGRALVASLRQSKMSHMTRILAHLSMEELTCLNRGLAALLKAVEAHKGEIVDEYD